MMGAMGPEGATGVMPAAIFFDNDGVLVDTEHLYMQATREVLATLGIGLSDEQYVDLFLRQNRGMLQFAEQHGWTPSDTMQLRATRNGIYAELLARESCVLDGVDDLLASLHGRVRMAIVTSSRRDHFDIIHARSGLLKYFDFVLADGDYAASKPDPAPYLAALARVGLERNQCLVVEDSERGLMAANAAGLRCVIVPSRLTKGQQFDGAWRVIADVRDVASVIEASSGPASYRP